MKTLHIIRHAKSSWNNGSLADIDRPLNERGIRTCSFMAQYISDAGCRFENVYCSPAVRAQTTIELISENITDTVVKWHTDKELYTFDGGHLYRWLSTVDDSISELVIVGHNPGLTDLSNELGNRYISNIPTCGYVQLVTEEECSWQDISNITFDRAVFLKPKEVIE